MQRPLLWGLAPEWSPAYPTPDGYLTCGSTGSSRRSESVGMTCSRAADAVVLLHHDVFQCDGK